MNLRWISGSKFFWTSEETSTHCKLLISAVTHGGGVHRPDRCAGHSLMACPFADNSSLHVYLRLLSSLLPPSTRQPGPVAVLLGQTLKLRLIFHQSLTLFWSTEKHLAAASPEFSSAYFTTESLNFKSYFLFFLQHRSHDDHQ